jgi:hypothetical protein
VAPGCIVLTTAEVLLALLPDWQFTREPDALTGYDELMTRTLRWLAIYLIAACAYSTRASSQIFHKPR